MTELQEKYRAVLINTAVGEKVGMPVEGWKKSQIKRYYGKISGPIKPEFMRDKNGDVLREDQDGRLKYYTVDSVEGETDDLILTRTIAESLAENQKFSLEDIAKRHVQEIIDRTQPNGKILGGFGGSTIKSVKRLMEGVSPLKSGELRGAGNGPAMKMAPVGLFAHAISSEGVGLVAARSIGLMTHLDPRSVVSGEIQANCVFNLLIGVSREGFFNQVLKTSSYLEQPLTEEYFLYENGSLTERLKWISEDLDREDEEVHEEIGSGGLVYESYPFTLFMFQKYWDNPTQGLLNLVNFGGDTDTTGAIYGALVGARDGLVFPKDWMDQIKSRDRLIAAADGIYELRSDI